MNINPMESNAAETEAGRGRDAGPLPVSTPEPEPLALDSLPSHAAFVVTPAPSSRTPSKKARNRSLALNLVLLLCLTLSGFVLTTWILIRMDTPLGVFSTGPREVVREQLVALDRGEVRGAYNLLSGRYREQVTFELWRELILRQWQMFHAEVVRAGNPTQSGAQATVEIHLRGADQKAYRGRFKLIRTGGRWWIDDVHWAQEADDHDVSRT